jgi:hypothetical protein
MDHDAEQPEQIERVKEKIGRVIRAFVTMRGIDGEFHADELRAYVRASCPSLAPASPDRILRALRQDGLLNYEVVSRRGSRYRIKPVGTLL